MGVRNKSVMDEFISFEVIDKFIIIIKKDMGCGAVCGNNSSISQQNVFEQKILLTLMPQIKHRKQFIPTSQFTLMMSTIREDPIKYKLRVPSKLVSGEYIDCSILTKWRVILYCLDTDNEHFQKCLGHNLLLMSKKNSQQFNSSLNRQCVNESQQTAMGNVDVEQHGEREDREQLNDWRQQQQPSYALSQSGIFPHKEFMQIEKDINRTCDLPENKKPVFERILKRISNYFPKMGYTQGINFIIGYLLMIGLQQFDVFWMFVHIAISRRYLLLGLFQDKFPLSDIYKHVFKNVLKRINPSLYQHLYDHLKMNESVWVFKWFFTYFIYSFPFEMIKYVFDVVIQIGGLGLVKFAIAITQQLEAVLMEEHDQCEISIFFQSLRDIQTFNQYISINKVVERVYNLEIKREDFHGIQHDTDNFYAQYIMANLQASSQNNNNYPRELALEIKVENTGEKVENKDDSNNHNHKQSQENNERQALPNRLLKEWYEKLLLQRTQFIAAKTNKCSSSLTKINQNVRKTSDQLKDKKLSQRTSLENQLNLLIYQPSSQTLQQDPSKSPQRDDSTKSNKDSSFKDSFQIKKNSSIPSTGYSSYNQKDNLRQNGDNVSEIDELWDEQDCNSSASRNMSSKISQQSRTQNGFIIKAKKTQYEDQLDKFASTHCNPLNKSKYNNPQFNKTSSIFNDQKLTSYRPKINNFQIPSDLPKGRHLMKAGQNVILTNLSIQNCPHYQSSNSQYSKMSQRQKKNKQSDLYSRNQLRTKMKKQVSLTHHHHHQAQQDIGKLSANNSNRIQSQQDCNSSSIQSFIDPQNSFCASHGFIQQNELGKDNNEAFSVRGVESYRGGRTITHQDSINNYLHSSNIKMAKSRDVVEYNASEIELFQPPQQVFKKKNRVSFRVDGVQKQGATEILRTKLSHVTSNANIPNTGKTIESVKFGIEQSINYEQSYESIFVPSEGQKQNTFRFHQQLQKCEIESVK